MSSRLQSLFGSVAVAVLVTIAALVIVSLPHGRAEEPAVHAVDIAPTISVSADTPAEQTWQATGIPVTGLTVYAAETSVWDRPLELRILDTQNNEIARTLPFRYEHRGGLLAIIYEFHPIDAPAKTPLRFSVDNYSDEPISLIVNKDGVYTNGALHHSSVADDIDLAFSLRHSTPTSPAITQGVLVGLLALAGGVLVQWVPRRKWLISSILVVTILPLAVAGFWFSPNEWGQSDWDLYFPMYEAYRVSVLEHHSFPLWNPYTYGGVSALGDPEFAVIAPSFLLLLLFGVPSGFKIAILFTIAISGLGMLALGRKVGLSALAALLAAFVFPLSSTVLLKLVEGHVQHLAIAWVPWIFWAWLATYRKHALATTSIRAQLIHPWSIVTGALLALTFYQGGIYMLFYIIPALFVLIPLASSKLAALITTAGAGMWSFGFSAFKVLPVIQWIREFPDAAFVSSSFSLPYWYDIYLHPHLHGVRILPNQSGGWHEYGAYIGPVVLLLILVAISQVRRSRMTAVLLAGVALAALTAAAGPLLGPVFDVITWLPRSNISRIALYAVFNGALLAGVGLDVIIRHSSGAGRHLAPSILGITAISIMALSYPMSEQAFIIPRLVPEVRAAPSPIAFTREAHTLNVRGLPENRSYANALAGYGTLVYRPPLAPPLAIVPMSEDEHSYLTVSDKSARVKLSSWKPNTVTLTVESETETVVTLNTNFSRGWQANEAPAQKNGGRVSATVLPGTKTVTFSYRPPGINTGIFISLLTIVGAVWLLLSSMLVMIPHHSLPVETKN